MASLPPTAFSSLLAAHAEQARAHAASLAHVAALLARVESDALAAGGLDAVLRHVVEVELGAHGGVACDEYADGFAWWLADGLYAELVAVGGALADALRGARAGAAFWPSLQARLLDALLVTLPRGEHEPLLRACVAQWRREGPCRVCRDLSGESAARPRDAFVATLVGELARRESET